MLCASFARNTAGSGELKELDAVASFFCLRARADHHAKRQAKQVGEQCAARRKAGRTAKERDGLGSLGSHRRAVARQNNIGSLGRTVRELHDERGRKRSADFKEFDLRRPCAGSFEELIKPSGMPGMLQDHNGVAAVGGRGLGEQFLAPRVGRQNDASRFRRILAKGFVSAHIERCQMVFPRKGAEFFKNSE